MISCHTFELTKEVDTNEYQQQRNKVKDKKKYNNELARDFSFVKEGMTVWYHQTKYKKKIKLIINPSRLLGGDDLISLWKPKKKNIIELLDGIDEFITQYFGSKYELNDFTLTRIDFTKNIRLENGNEVSAYIKALYNIRKVKGFSPKYNKNDEWYNKDWSFDLEGNSSGIAFTAYDKHAEIEEGMKNQEYKRKELEARLEYAKGLLRLETKLTTQKAIRNYTNEKETVSRLVDLFEKSDEIFLDTFLRVVPPGDFYKKDQAVSIIDDNVQDKKLKRKMVRLLELIPIKKSLHMALKEMNDRRIEKVFKEFHKLNLSPVTISKRQDIKHLTSLHAFF